MTIKDMLYCPVCSRKLEVKLHAKQYLCEACATSWPVIDNVPVFSSSQYYYGELDQKFINDLLSRMDSLSLERIQDEALFTANQWFTTYIFDQSRADWRFLLPLSKGMNVLDFGCGMGAITLAVADQVGSVCAIDPVLERTRFVNKMARKSGLENVNAICTNIDALPFASHSFDLIFMNGVLEWIPTSNKEGDPYTIHIKTLKKVHELLKQNGVFYLGIENRIGAPYFLGWPDDHSHLRWTSLMPRKLANVYMRLRGRTDGYRTYTYSYRGVKNILAQAGLKTTTSYFPVPYYHTPTNILPYDNISHFKAALQYYFKHIISLKNKKRLIAKKIFPALPGKSYLRHFVPSFIIFCCKYEDRRAEIKGFAHHLISEWNLVESASEGGWYLVLQKGRGGLKSMCRVLLFDSGSKPKAIIKIARSREGGAILLNEVFMIEAIKRKCPHLKHTLIEPLNVRTDYPQAVAYRFHECIDFSKLIVQQPLEAQCRIHNLLKIKTEIDRMTFNPDGFSKFLESIQNKVKLLTNWMPENQYIFNNILNEVKIREKVFSNFCAFTHGDFVSSNLLIARDSEKIIDWEASSPFGVSTTDLYYLAYDAHCYETRNWHNNTDVVKILTEIFQQQKASPICKTILETIEISAQKDDQVGKILFNIFLLERIFAERHLNENEACARLWLGYLIKNK